MCEGTFKDNGEEITFELQLPPKKLPASYFPLRSTSYQHTSLKVMHPLAMNGTHEY